MDKRVLFTMVAIIFLASISIAFKALTKKDCVPPAISYFPENPEPGQKIKFISQTDPKNKITWNFGDNTSESANEVEHTFDAPGDYIVKAMYNETCENEIKVHIAKARKMERVSLRISIPDEMHAGELVSFNDRTYEATEWLWSIKETEETATAKSFSPIFKKPGKYTLSLSVKGDFINGDTTLNIEVLKAIPVPVAKPAPVIVPKPAPVIVPKPKPEPKPEPKPAPKPEPKPAPSSSFLSDKDFAGKFLKIANAIGKDDETASDDWRDLIVTQGCGDPKSMLVELSDGDQIIKTLSLERFKRNQIAEGAYEVTAVQVLKRGPKNCIFQIKVTIKK